MCNYTNVGALCWGNRDYTIVILVYCENFCKDCLIFKNSMILVAVEACFAVNYQLRVLPKQMNWTCVICHVACLF